jgi:hypothetical protein
MPIRVICNCGKQYSLPDEHAGKHFRCKACAAIVPIAPTTPPSKADENLQFSTKSDSFEEYFSVEDYAGEYSGNDSFPHDPDTQPRKPKKKARASLNAPKPPANASEEDSKRSRLSLVKLFCFGLVGLAAVAAIVLVLGHESSRRAKLAREEFENLRKTAEQELAQGKIEAAQEVFTKLSEHVAAENDLAKVVLMRDTLTRVLSIAENQSNVQTLSDQELFELATAGNYKDADSLSSELQILRVPWISRLQPLAISEIARRKNEKRSLLSTFADDLSKQLSLLHGSDATTLDSNNRNEVEEKIARRWLDQFWERAPDSVKSGFELSNWIEMFSVADPEQNDAKLLAEAWLIRMKKTDYEELLKNAERVFTNHSFEKITVNMKEVPRSESLTTRFIAAFSLTYVTKIAITGSNGSVHSVSATMTTEFTYAWRSNKWELTSPDDIDLPLSLILPKKF